MRPELLISTTIKGLTGNTSSSLHAPKPDAECASDSQHHGSTEQCSEWRSDQCSWQSVEKLRRIEIKVRRAQDNEPTAENHQLCCGSDGLKFTTFPFTHFVSTPNCYANDRNHRAAGDDAESEFRDAGGSVCIALFGSRRLDSTHAIWPTAFRKDSV